MGSKYSVNIDPASCTSTTISIHNIRFPEEAIRMISIEVNDDGSLIIYGDITEPKLYDELDYIDRDNLNSRAYKLRMIGDKE